MSYSLSGLLAACGKEASSGTLGAITIGMALPLLAERTLGQPQTLAHHLDRLAAGLVAHQIGLRFGRFGQLCGCVQWARVTPEVSDRLLRYGTDSLQPLDMHGGDETWILDFSVRHGEAPRVLACLRDDWLRASPRVTYFRVKRGRRIAKRVSRADPTSFFRRPSRLASEARRFLETKEGAGLRASASNSLDAAIELGEVALLARHIPAIATLPLPQALTRLRVPLNHLQRRLYRGPDGVLCGFLAWAWMDTTLTGGYVPAPHQLAPFQWNEGNQLVLCDAMATACGVAPMTADLERGLFPGEPIWLRSADEDGASSPPRRLGSADFDGLRTVFSANQFAIDLHQQLRTGAGGIS